MSILAQASNPEGRTEEPLSLADRERASLPDDNTALVGRLCRLFWTSPRQSLKVGIHGLWSAGEQLPPMAEAACHILIRSEASVGKCQIVGSKVACAMLAQKFL